MKAAGKKAGLMPPNKAEVESPAEDQGENEATETTKKTGTTDGKSNKLGGGGRFQQLKNKGMSGGLAAYIGRKKFGASKMAKMAGAGKKSA